VILRRTNGASLRQSPNAALPSSSSPIESEAPCANTAGASNSEHANAAVTLPATIARRGERHANSPLRWHVMTGPAAMVCVAVSMCASGKY